ncbi:UbiA family prenyltransferase [Sulfuriroseicoccus oceanibius]|uniref:UbiA family prenyltransferase n=1 Tax=Sulfuriroseicoccus oceanibius TaxID=2707525 RepID=A0A6B3LBJ4_9BACT|nr:UbiA family prenyltransferase [Sulfuriroseicoccus oceanibius]QQL45629.1 UbiA family prenyltransferase [Sulfuriroseicoccus oceanibius]
MSKQGHGSESVATQPLALVRAMRPHHWVKNAFCAAAIVFSGNLTKLDLWWDLLVLVVAFCFASSAGYLINDVVNRHEDREHPRKRMRPVASGRVSVLAACLAAAGLAMVAVSGAGLWFAESGSDGQRAVACVAGYLGLSLVYSLVFRRVPVLDVLVLAIGFVLRVMAGAYAIGVAPSGWLIGVTYALAVLLGLGKRRGELSVLERSGGDLGSTRHALMRYVSPLEKGAVELAAVVVAAVYAMYCVHHPQAPWFLITVAPVFLGLWDYVRRTRRSVEVEVPEALMFKFGMLPICLLVWGALVIWFSLV